MVIVFAKLLGRNFHLGTRGKSKKRKKIFLVIVWWDDLAAGLVCCLFGGGGGRGEGWVLWM